MRNPAKPTNLGIVREQLGDTVGARGYDAPSVGLEALAASEHGSATRTRGQFEEAERYYKQVLERAPKEEEALPDDTRLQLKISGAPWRLSKAAGSTAPHGRRRTPTSRLHTADSAERPPNVSTRRCRRRSESMDALRGLAALSIQANDFDTPWSSTCA